MKNKIKLLLLAALALHLAFSCGKEGGPSDGPSAPSSSISVNPASLTLSQEGETQRVSVKASGKWAVNGSVPWLQLSPDSGDGDDIISFTAGENPDTDERNATFTLVCGDVSTKITVSQKQKDALTVTSNKQEISAAGGSVDIEVKANVDYSVEIDPACKNWISRAETKSMLTTHVILEVAQNIDFEKREGKVTIKSGSLSEKISIYQEGSEPVIVISQSEYTLPASGSELKIEVKSNVDVEVSLPDGVDWITEAKTKSVSTNTFRYIVKANASEESRSAKIVFSNSEHNLRDVVKVTQMPKSAIIVAKSSYEIGSEGGTLTFDVQHNTEYSVSVSAGWVVREQTKVMQTTTETFSVQANPDYDSRTAIITVTSADNAVKQEIKLVQKQLDVVLAEKEEMEIKGEGGEFDLKLQSNAKYLVEISDPDWIHQVSGQTKSLVSSSLRFTADANNTGEDRVGWIRIKIEGSSKVTAIKLSQPAIEMAQSNAVYNVGPEGGLVSVNLVTNVPFYSLKITPSEASYWLEEVASKSTRTDVLTFNVAKNIEYAPREAVVTVKSNSTGAALTSFTIKQNPQPVPGNVIIYTTKYDYALVLKVTTGYGANLMDNTYSDGLGRLIFDDDIKSIPDNAFEGLNTLTSIIIPGNTANIGRMAFYNCASMIDITLPESVTSIGEYAFSGCTGTLHYNCISAKSTSSGGNSFTAIEIGPEVKKIPDYCFRNSKTLETITLPSSVTTIGNYAFADCTSLKSANLGSGLSSIGQYAFDGCKNLDTVTIMSKTPPSLPDSKYNPFYVFYIPSAKLVFPSGKDWEYASKGYYRYFSNLPSISYSSLNLNGYTSTTADFSSDDVTIKNALGGESFNLTVYCSTSSSSIYYNCRTAVMTNGKCTVTGLTPNTTYYYCCVCTISYNGKSYTWERSDFSRSFTTYNPSNDGDNEPVTEEDWNK